MHDFTNKEIAKMLNELADLMEISGENRFKVRAYANASRKIMAISVDLKKLASEKRLTEIDGIGQGIAKTIYDTFTNGYCPPLEEIRGELPSGVLELIQLPGLGPKRAHQLFYELGIQSLEDLKKAINQGQIKKLKGFGPKIEEKIKKSMENYEEFQEVFLLYHAQKYADELIKYMKENSEVIKIERAGSIRRQKELIGDIDLLVSSRENKVVMEHFINYPLVKEVLLKGDSKTSIIVDGNIQVDLRVVTDDEFPTSLQYFTGSKEHNVRLREIAKKSGYKLNEYGLYRGDKRIIVKSEDDIYNALGLDYIPPELREDRGEIEAAKEGNLPESIVLKDIKGDLHMHSRYSDGAYSIREMVEAAREMGYQYIAITDHSQSLRVAHGMTPDTLLKEMEEIDNLQNEFQDITILKGVEVDINSDGSLDYSDDILARLDIVIASIHTGFNQSREQITKRILKAMENPYVNIIGHPQGRILKKRKPYDVDMKEVIRVASETGTSLEINSSPYRLDLDDQMVIEAKRAGVKIAINTDAHHIKEFKDMKLGVAVARRGWLTKDDVINTMEIKDLKRFLRSD